MKKNEMTKKLMEEFNEDFIDVGGVLDTTLPDPTMVEYYRRLKKREILWNDDISDATIDIALYIKKWNAEDKGIAPEERKPIKIFINSDGGSVDTVPPHHRHDPPVQDTDLHDRYGPSVQRWRTSADGRP